MNAKVEEYIARVSARAAEQAENQRREIIEKAGIYNETKETVSGRDIVFDPMNHVYLTREGGEDIRVYYDQEKEEYYKRTRTPIDLTDEEYAEVLKAAMTEKDLDAKSTSEKYTTRNDGAENTLRVIATITLILGIISSVICFATLCFTKVPAGIYGNRTETVFNASGLVTALSILLASIVLWAGLKVFANISLTLVEINRKIK